MLVIDILVYIMMGIGGITIIFVMYAKKRMDNNEPVFGWRRKQFLQEQGGQSTSAKDKSASRKGEETIKDLIGIQSIWRGIFEKDKNEYCIIVATDSVNFDLLSDGARGSIILGYQSLFRVIRFPVQILGQAIRQDLRKEEQRWMKNLKESSPQTQQYNQQVIDYIKDRSEKEFRISRKVYYVITYRYEAARLGSLNPEQKERRIETELLMRARTVMGMLKRARVESELLDSLFAMEVMKRALNRDRMLYTPIEGVVEPGKEKITSYITADVTTLPGFEDLVYDVEEVREDVQFFEEEKSENKGRQSTA